MIRPFQELMITVLYPLWTMAGETQRLRHTFSTVHAADDHRHSADEAAGRMPCLRCASTLLPARVSQATRVMSSHGVNPRVTSRFIAEQVTVNEHRPRYELTC